MSNELPPEPGDETLDRLLVMTADPPQLDPDARARLLARLQRSREVDLSPAATPGRPRAPELPMSVPPPNRFRPALGYALAVAATGLLVWSTTSLLLPDVTPDAPDQKDSLAELGEVRNDAARPRLVTLADGSTLILREGAAFSQLGPRRLELLRGEALLEVVPGSEPFSVTTTAGEVEVRGTKFLLRQDDTGLLASVLRGELRLVNPAGEATLQSGESANLAKGTAPVKRPAERLSHEVAWARDALADASDTHKAVRRGNLLGRFPTWNREWPLPVRSMDVDVHVEDGVARTTIDQTFFNHSDYQLEGVYSFPLPADAAISRLAMYVDGKLMEAGITERQEGREIYESIVYRRRDPALLEWMQGNEFRMRIFPLPARTEKRILLSYTQPLESLYGDYSVRVPIPELDLPVGTLRYRIHVKDKTLSVDSCCVELTTRDEGEFRIAEATLKNVPIG
ncbi:MAG TPA: VIT domain-containing protein, partial [Nannocystis sp.]